MLNLLICNAPLICNALCFEHLSASPPTAQSLGSKHARKFNGKFCNASGRIIFAPVDAKQQFQFSMDRETAENNRNEQFDWEEFMRLISGSPSSGSPPHKLFVDMERGLYSIGDNFVQSFAALDPIGSLGWRSAARVSKEPVKVPAVEVDDCPTRIFDAARELGKLGLQNLSIDNSNRSNMKIKAGTHELQLKDIPLSGFLYEMTGRGQNTCTGDQKKRVAAFRKTLNLKPVEPPASPPAARIQANPPGVSSPTVPIAATDPTGDSRLSTGGAKALRDVRPNTGETLASNPKGLESVHPDTGESSGPKPKGLKSGHPATGDSLGPKPKSLESGHPDTGESSGPKRSVWLSVLLTSLLTVGSLGILGTGIFLNKRKKAKKRGTQATGEKKKSGTTTVPVRFSTKKSKVIPSSLSSRQSQAVSTKYSSLREQQSQRGDSAHSNFHTAEGFTEFACGADSLKSSCQESPNSTAVTGAFETVKSTLESEQDST
eukprot:GHVT01014310.1.p2 GENE.GHVT01014310.1~~GHVT01014310.1.p2  ORF type:complete len:489 (-),score=86.71 GHVT01014310.1:820-2286(-)